MKQRLIAVAGPTASGKTSLAIALAKHWNGEVISADSMQVYRGMDIGTAKVTTEEMQGVPHHLIDILDPKEEWNVMRFRQMAEEAIQDIISRGKMPVICGGTGFYLRALLYDARFDEEEGQPELRIQLEEEMRQFGPEEMHARLQAVDSVSARLIHPNNQKRVIRALEYYQLHHRPISDHNEEQKQRESRYDFVLFGISMDRQKLYQRIDARVDQMIRDGLKEEVRKLLSDGLPAEATAMQGLGYKEWLPCLEGLVSEEETIRILKRDTRHFAKRQLTWFRAEPEMIWLDGEQGAEAVIAQADDIIRRRFCEKHG